MPCESCSAEFGILKKEVGCEVCGFSFCSKCCKKQIVPSESGESQKKLICNKCYRNLTSEEPSARAGSPPLAHKRRMAALKKQSCSVDSGSGMSFSKSGWSNEKDKELIERLQRLKRDRIKDDLPSEVEIEERLAKLKGMDPSRYKAPPVQVYRPADRRTSIEQASDLMKQIKEEVDLDSKLVKPEDEIAARLASLRDEAPKNTGDMDSTSLLLDSSSVEEMDIEKSCSLLQEKCVKLSDVSKEIKELNSNPEYRKFFPTAEQGKETLEESDEEEEANKLVEKLMASNIDTEVEELDSLNDQEAEKSSSKSDEEEFPWCIICTEDAKIRCFGCDGDLYCMHCFKESHDSLDIQDHKTCPFLPPKNALL